MLCRSSSESPQGMTPSCPPGLACRRVQTAAATMNEVPRLPVDIAASELDEIFQLVDSVTSNISHIIPQSSQSHAPVLQDDGVKRDMLLQPLLSPPLLESAAGEEKREKSRGKERRKYRRRKEKMSDLQRQVETLEHQLQQLSARSSPEINDGDTIEVDIKSRGDHEQLKMQLIKLELVKSRLRSENTELRRQFREASQRAMFLSDILKAEHKLYYAHSSYFRLLKPLSRHTCWELNRQALKRMDAFEAELRNVSAIGSMAGWKGKRFVADNLFKFALDKTFHHVNPHKILSELWSNLVDPRNLERMYSAEMNMRVRLVQMVDEDNYVFLEEMRSADPGDNGAPVKIAVLFSRLRTATGYRIHIIYLDRQQIEMEDRSTGKSVDIDGELWVSSEKLTWIELEVIDNGTISDKFRGIFPTIGASAYFWMAEIVLVCLRAEMVGFGRRFSVTSS